MAEKRSLSKIDYKRFAEETLALCQNAIEINSRGGDVFSNAASEIKQNAEKMSENIRETFNATYCKAKEFHDALKAKIQTSVQERQIKSTKMKHAIDKRASLLCQFKKDLENMQILSQKGHVKASVKEILAMTSIRKKIKNVQADNDPSADVVSEFAKNESSVIQQGIENLKNLLFCTNSALFGLNFSEIDPVKIYLHIDGSSLIYVKENLKLYVVSPVTTHEHLVSGLRLEMVNLSSEITEDLRFETVYENAVSFKSARLGVGEYVIRCYLFGKPIRNSPLKINVSWWKPQINYAAISTAPKKKWNTEEEQGRKLFIGGLTYSITDDTLKDFYSQWGELVDYVVMKDPSTKKSRCFGFVTYADATCVNSAMSNRPHVIEGKTVEPKRALPRQDSKKPEKGVNFKETAEAECPTESSEKSNVATVSDLKNTESSVSSCTKYSNPSNESREIYYKCVSVDGKLLTIKKSTALKIPYFRNITNPFSRKHRLNAKGEMELEDGIDIRYLQPIIASLEKNDISLMLSTLPMDCNIFTLIKMCSNLKVPLNVVYNLSYIQEGIVNPLEVGQVVGELSLAITLGKYDEMSSFIWNKIFEIFLNVLENKSKFISPQLLFHFRSCVVKCFFKFTEHQRKKLAISMKCYNN